MRNVDKALIAGLAILACNSAYLAAGGDPDLFYFFNIALHFGLGLVLVVVGVQWWRRHRPSGTTLAAVLLVTGAVLGIAIAVVGNRYATRPLVWIHAGVATAGLIALLAAFRRFRSRLSWRLSTALLAVCVIAVPTALWIQRTNPPAAASIENPPAPVSMDHEAMQGAGGPFFPSSVHTANRGTVPSSIYLKPESCARSGCHPDIYAQWKSSAHHFSSFNNQWYRQAVVYMQQVAGVTSSKWCGGCHDPAVLQSGMMDTPIVKIMHTPEAQAGLTCTACHMISSVHSTMGNGDYQITVPPLHNLATSDNLLLTSLHDFLVRLNPRPHRRTFIQPFFRGAMAPRLCSACHKVHLDVPVNHYRWLRGFNEYDNWQASGVSGFGARSFYYPPQPRACTDCHMPQVASDDAGNRHGLVHSHRFAAANSALPTANKDDVQLKAVEDFLKARQVTVDIFAMTHGQAEPGVTEPGRYVDQAGQLSTSFAVGEEQGMQVGAGRGAGGTKTEIYAPLDEIPATVRRGESTRIDVVVRTRGVGHFFPGGTVDAYDCWLELKAVDDTGKVIYWSGKADLQSPVDPGAHFYRALLIDAHGHPINKRNAYMTRASVYVRLIPPGAADTVHFRLQVPPDAGDTITLTAHLNYRKFSWYNTHWAYSGVPDPNQQGAEYTPDYDDRRFVFTGDTSGVAGEIKQVPTLPIVDMAEASVKLNVLGPDAALPDMTQAQRGEDDRERWNDYGIGLLLQGDLIGARHAFQRVTELEPDYPDGWVNLGRVAVSEGDLATGRRVLQRALTLAPDLPRAHFFMALIEKEAGNYPTALRHLATARAQYPEDRVVLNQIGRVQFLQRNYREAIDTLQNVLAIDPEDLMAHYTLMLSYRGLGNMEASAHHQRLYERFKANEASQILTGQYREEHPEDNNERQRIHEHVSAPLPPVSTEATAAAG
jgi:tetratricopeptide (TPR) repeat protein